MNGFNLKTTQELVFFLSFRVAGTGFPFLEKICGLQLRLVFVIAHRLERKSPRIVCPTMRT